MHPFLNGLIGFGHGTGLVKRMQLGLKTGGYRKKGLRLRFKSPKKLHGCCMKTFFMFQ
jgi:hypothetical protein